MWTLRIRKEEERMTVDELRKLLEPIDGSLEVIIQATSYDDDYVVAVDGVRGISLEDRSDGLKLYILGERESK